MNIRKVNKEDFDDILNLQLQLEDTEIMFDCNLKERCYETNKGKEKLTLEKDLYMKRRYWSRVDEH